MCVLHPKSVVNINNITALICIHRILRLTYKKDQKNPVLIGLNKRYGSAEFSLGKEVVNTYVTPATIEKQYQQHNEVRCTKLNTIVQHNKVSTRC